MVREARRPLGSYRLHIFLLPEESGAELLPGQANSGEPATLEASARAIRPQTQIHNHPRPKATIVRNLGNRSNIELTPYVSNPYHLLDGKNANQIDFIA